MPVVTLYPVLQWGSSYTNPQNVLGDDASEASYTWRNESAGFRLGFDWTTLPAGATINSIAATLEGRCNVANTKRHSKFALRSSLRSQSAGGPGGSVPGVNIILLSNYTAANFLTSTKATYSFFTISSSQFTSANWTVNALRTYGSDIQVEVDLWGANTTSSTAWVSRIWLTVDYNNPPAGNALFFGENF